MTTTRIMIKKPRDPLSPQIDRMREIVRMRYRQPENKESAPAGQHEANRGHLTSVDGALEGLV